MLVPVIEINALLEKGSGVVALTSESNGYCRIDSPVTESSALPGTSHFTTEFGEIYVDTDSTLEIEIL